MNTRFITLLLALTVGLAAPSCMFRGSSQSTIFGMEVTTESGEFSVDGRPVPFVRTETVVLDLAAVTDLTVATASGPIELTGVEGTTAELEVEIRSEVEGDGRVGVVDGRLMSTSDQGLKTFVNVVRGSVPAGVVARVSSGTGDVTLGGLVRDGELRVETGTSRIDLHDGSAESTRVHSGVGEVALRAWTTGRLSVETGTSGIELDGAAASEVSITSGTGAVTAADCRFGDVDVETGTSDVTFTDTVCSGTLDCTSGTGDLELRGGSVGRLVTEFGTGELSRSETEVGSHDA